MWEIRHATESSQILGPSNVAFDEHSSARASLPSSGVFARVVARVGHLCRSGFQWPKLTVQPLLCLKSQPCLPNVASIQNQLLDACPDEGLVTLFDAVPRSKSVSRNYEKRLPTSAWRIAPTSSSAAKMPGRLPSRSGGFNGCRKLWTSCGR